MTDSDIRFLNHLEMVIRERLAEGGTDSYTASLAASGDKRIAQKVGEEAVELALASVAGSQTELLEEAADLIYHLLVLLNMRNLGLSDVVTTLESRHTG